MTGEPAWVKAAREIDYGSDNHRVSELQEDATSLDLKNSLSLSDNGRLSAVPDCLELKCELTLLYTFTSKEEMYLGPSLSDWHVHPDLRAGFTCPMCPNPLVNLVRYTKRCRPCNTKIVRWTRAKRLLKDIELVTTDTTVGVRWITLTVPNYECPQVGMKDLKKKMRNFRMKKEFKEHVVGTADFYEWTISRTFHSLPPQWMWNTNSEKHPHDKEYNVHIHALWVGSYWKQKNLLKEWGHGGARIEDARVKSKKCLNYVLNYAKKQHQLGIRSQQRTGCLYGRAFAELKLALTQEET